MPLLDAEVGVSLGGHYNNDIIQHNIMLQVDQSAVHFYALLYHMQGNIYLVFTQNVVRGLHENLGYISPLISQGPS